MERPGGERYWDGSAWTEHRRPGAAAAPETAAYQPTGYQQPQYQQPQYQQPQYQQPGFQQPGFSRPGAQPPAYAPPGYQPYSNTSTAYQKSAVAGWALGLSIVGLVCCGFLAIAGTIMGWTQMKAVDRGERDPGSRGTAKAAFIVGIVGISINLGFLVIYLIAIAASAG